jgi:hypothetical protein
MINAKTIKHEKLLIKKVFFSREIVKLIFAQIFMRKSALYIIKIPLLNFKYTKQIFPICVVLNDFNPA